MDHNDVWDRVELPEGNKQIGCKWVYKTKSDSNGNVEDIRPDWLPKVLLKRTALTIKRHFHQSLRRTPLELL